MKGCAKFLNFIALLMFLFTLIVFVATCAATAVIGIKPDLITEDLLDTLKALTINGKPVSMEILTGFRIPVLILLGAAILFLLFSLITIGKIRTALGEVGRGEPFSIRCSSALSSAGTLTILSGLISIAASVYSVSVFGGFSVDGATVLGYSSNLSFILVAILLKMLAGVSEFGRG